VLVNLWGSGLKALRLPGWIYYNGRICYTQQQNGSNVETKRLKSGYKRLKTVTKARSVIVWRIKNGQVRDAPACGGGYKVLQSPSLLCTRGLWCGFAGGCRIITDLLRGTDCHAGKPARKDWERWRAGKQCFPLRCRWRVGASIVGVFRMGAPVRCVVYRTRGRMEAVRVS